MKPPKKRELNMNGASMRGVQMGLAEDDGYNQAIDDMKKWIEEADLCLHCYEVLKGEK